MKYDNYGNIIEKNGKAYTYGDAKWKDLLTGFDGETIEYDAQGNPVKYLGHTLTWEKGRQLKSFDSNTYTYNANGIRTSKTVNGVKHEYTLDGTKILRETWDGNTLIPLYDNEDGVCGILYNNVPYYFIKNLQGDVIAIVDKDAQTVARYSYDAWGVPKVKLDSSDCQIATINPFRYRGYYYDEEIGFYYLQSRYYNASIGSFVNVDGCELIKEITWSNKNLFAYCNRDPVNNADLLGMSTTLIIGGVTSTVGQLIALVACVAFLYLYLFDARFRDAINQLIYSICMMIANGLRYLSNVITDAIAKARSSRRYRGTEDHHIVAQSDRRAKNSRTMIQRYLIFTWHPVNIVTISKTLHKHLHTNAYFAAIDLCVASVYYMNTTWSDKRMRLIALLLTISVILKTASQFI